MNDIKITGYPKKIILIKKVLMGTGEAIKKLGDREFLDKLYGFAYKRCSSSHEAEDLCSEILCAILRGIQKNTEIKNFYAFAWTVAHRIYADFCEKRRQQGEKLVSWNSCTGTSHSISGKSTSYVENLPDVNADQISDYIESEYDRLQYRRIMREISFLSKIYRDVMVMFYLDEKPVAEIARELNISENTVRQRLFSARNTIKKEVVKTEVVKMDTSNLSLKPVHLAFWGTGKPVGNDPRKKAERTFSQNLVYLCKDTERSAREISELLGVPMVYVEEELDIQCRGENGHYGLLRRLDNGKYISNCIIVDAEDFKTAASVYNQYIDALTDRLAAYIEANKDRILRFPFLSKQTDVKFITWSLICHMIWGFERRVFDFVKSKHISNIEILKREFSLFCIAARNAGEIDFGFFGCDGIYAMNVCGYSYALATNIYGKRIKAHFHCGHNISNDPLLLITLRAIDGGIEIDRLSENEKEIAAKAIEEGYLRKEGGRLIPKVLVMDKKNEQDFYDLATSFSKEVDDIANTCAKSIAEMVRKFVPKHVMNEYNIFVQMSTCGVLHNVIEKCIEKGILNAPESSPCAEGTWIVVKK